MNVTFGWSYFGSPDYIVFSTDKDITLHGLSLFGSENKNYTVKLKVQNTSKNSAVATKTGTFPSKRLECEDFYYYGYEVLFDSAADLKKNTKYQIEALISGAVSWKGEGGLKTVLRSGVTFTFSNSNSKNGNGTSEDMGQFPEFLFSVL